MPMKPIVPRILLGILLISGISGPALMAKGRIVISATASPEFTQMSQDPDKIWFFQVAEGVFFGGNVRDDSLTNVEFEDIILIIGNQLKRRNMFPHIEQRKGDFLLVIHWGATDWEDDLDSFFPDGFQDAEGNLDVDLVNTMNSWNYNTRRLNAALTGFDKVLYGKRRPAPWEEAELREALSDSRYFIVVNAIDYQLLQNTGEVKLLWTTRFSTRSPGTNFEIAHEDLINAAGGYFGKNLDGLEKERAGVDTGEVKIGEIEVIETIEENP